MYVVKKIAVISLLLFIPSLSMGEVYRWVDENGQVHFGNVPPKVQQPYKAGDLKKEDNPSLTSQDQKQVKSETGKSSGIASSNATDAKKGDIKAESGAKTPSNEQPAVDYKARSEEEKKQQKVLDKQRDEKFNALINRLKKDLGIPKQQEEEQEVKQEVKQEVQQQEKKEQRVEEQANQQPSPQENQPRTENVSVDQEENNLTNSGEQAKTAEKDIKNKGIESKTVTKAEEHEAKKEHEANKEVESVEKADVEVNEKCGFFKSFVENYEDRMKYECPSEHCDLIMKKLEKYRNKVKEYCGDGKVSPVNQ